MQIRPRRLIATVAALLACALPVQAETLRLVSNVRWSHPDPWFGGFSGIEISDDGQTFNAITDRGRFLRARLTRDAGRITAIQIISHRPMTYPSGKRLANTATDAEGLAISASGRVYVSFEKLHRVTVLNPQTGATRRLPDHASFAGLPFNNGLEALAIHPDGALYTLPETSATRTTPFPLLRFNGTRWHVAHHIPRRGPFLAVGADFDRDGRLYLLERAVTPLGFRSRIRRFDLTAANLGETTLLNTFPGQFDNLEGLSLWRDTSGAIRITMISDDNFFHIQRNQIVEYVFN